MTVIRSLSILIALLTLAACQSSLMLMPTPEVLKDERFNVFEMNPDPLTGNELSVLFATTRVPTDGGTRFTGKPDTRLHLGYVDLRIGERGLNAFELIDQATTGQRTEKFAWQMLDAHTLNSVERPSAAGEGSRSLISDEVAGYMDALNQYIDRHPVKELTIYAHGANNTFYWSVSQAAQFQFFTGNNAMVLAFAWPSPGSAMRYGSDKRRANEAAADLAYLIELLAEHSRATRINLLAYSAGGRVVGGALAELGRRHSNPRELRIGQVYLTQSDEPLVDFVRSLPDIFPLVEGMTITAAPGDPVLTMARITDGRLRLGAMEEGAGARLDVSEEELARAVEIVNSDRVFLVDIRDVPEPNYQFAHGAWYESPWVSTDVMVTLLARGGMTAVERGLVSTKVGDTEVWQFPKDYVERLTAALLERQTRQ
jgi:esterase/lipase superfamily enzyme